MPNNPRRIYWDSCVYLAYLNGDEDRKDTLAQLLTEAGQTNRPLLTSITSIVEVAYQAEEKSPGPLNQAIEQALDKLWSDVSATEVVELNEQVAYKARQLLRHSLHTGKRLKPIDAIHLATADWACVDEFHTYDGSLLTGGFDQEIGCKVCQPYVQNPRLFTS